MCFKFLKEINKYKSTKWVYKITSGCKHSNSGRYKRDLISVMRNPVKLLYSNNYNDLSG